MVIYEYLRNFILTNWQSFLVGILASTIASGIVAISAIKVFRTPKLELHLDFIPQKTIPEGISLSVLDISVMNKKWWVGFGKEDVSFGLFIPTEFLNENKEMLLKTPNEGELLWTNDLRGKQKFIIQGDTYYLFRQMVHLPVYPESRIHFLRIRGNFSSDKQVKIFYYFETPYGKVPSSMRFGDRVKNAENGKLPYAVVEIN